MPTPSASTASRIARKPTAERFFSRSKTNPPFGGIGTAFFPPLHLVPAACLISDSARADPPFLYVPLPPKANAFCERLIGTIRRECLDFLIPLGERHLHRIVREWTEHYNKGRPHSSLGPGIPEPPQATAPTGPHRHKLPDGYRVTAKPVLGGLHHEYGLKKEAA